MMCSVKIIIFMTVCATLTF